MESNCCPATAEIVPHVTEQPLSPETFAVSLETRPRSGSRHRQDCTFVFCSKAVLPPVPAPTSRTCPRTHGSTREAQYAFQRRASAKMTSSCPWYTKGSLLIVIKG